MLLALRHNLPALIGFGVLIGIGCLARLLHGSIYSEAEVLDLFDALQRSALYLASAIATTAGTTLALMLTMIGLVRRVEAEFDMRVYRTVGLVGLTSAVRLIASVILLLTITLPVGEFEDMPSHWYRILYEFTFAMTIFVCALIVGIVLMLLRTVLTVIRTVTPESDT